MLPQISASLYECTPAWRIVRRRQRHDLLLLPLSGRAKVGIDGRWYALSPRRLLLAPRGSWVQAEAEAASPPRIVVLALRADALGGVPLQVAAGLPWAVQLRDEDGVERLLLEACREDAQRLPGWQPALSALVTQALVAVARRAGARAAIRRPADAGALARISPALAVMGQDLAQPMRIPELALACGLGAVQFRRLFRVALGRSPIAHLQRLRLAEAQRLIAGGSLVREAAEAVGYRSAACLDRVFRTLARTTPGRWRAKAVR
jgi:AraC-like DNA-binding protein